MADSAVKMQFFANAAAAEKAIVALERKYADLENKLRQVSRSSKRGAEDSSGGLSMMAGKLASVAAGYVAIPALIGTVLDAQRKLTQEADETALSYDKLFRKFRVQAGLTEVQAAESKQRILAAAQRVAVPEEFATAAATQMVSSGFSVEDATGKALDVLLKGFAAANLTDQDPTQLTQALGQFLASQGMDKNAENLKQVLVASQRLFKATDFQVSDLSQLAGKASGFVGRMSVPEVMASFDAIREVKGADTASTGLKIMVERLTGASEDPQRKGELRKLGLKATDVDFVGENIQEVLDRLAGGFDKLDPTKRAGVMQRLFGTEAAATSEFLIRERARIPKALAAASDVAGFDADVDIATSGRAAAAQRQEIAERIAAEQRAGTGALLGKELRTLHREAGFFEFSGYLAEKSFGMYRGLGMSDDWAARLSFGAERQDLDEARRRVERRMQGAAAQADRDPQMDEQTRVLRDIRDQQRPRVNRNAQGE